MLIEFRVENHRSLRDEQVFTMEASRVGDEDDRRPRLVSGYSEKLLTVGAFYGANASGKSNLLAALEYMRGAVSDSQRSWTPDGGVPHDPFAFGPKKIEPSLFEVSFIVDSSSLQYGFSSLRTSSRWKSGCTHGLSGRNRSGLREIWIASNSVITCAAITKSLRRLPEETRSSSRQRFNSATSSYCRFFAGSEGFCCSEYHQGDSQFLLDYRRN